jgi:hypothetical protein
MYRTQEYNPARRARAHPARRAAVLQKPAAVLRKSAVAVKLSVALQLHRPRPHRDRARL